MKLRRIFIDTNVLINAYTGKYTGNVYFKKCLDYVFHLDNAKIYTSANAVIVMFSRLQKKCANRPAISKQDVEIYYKFLRNKMEILDCTEKDIDSSIKLNFHDMEDNCQYIVGKKANCNVFITENYKDFKYFTDILVVNPKKYTIL
jgi:predicted nucleic acid-binding protein